jgi:hypothetical protein
MIFSLSFLSFVQYIIYSYVVDMFQSIMRLCKTSIFVKLHRQKCFPQSRDSHFTGTVRLPYRALTSASKHCDRCKSNNILCNAQKSKVFVKPHFIFSTTFLLIAVISLYLDILLNFLETFISYESIVSPASSTHHLTSVPALLYNLILPHFFGIYTCIFTC